jgi:pimeloyl-ACP methyl ester carboxylesterase
MKTQTLFLLGAAMLMGCAAQRGGSSSTQPAMSQATPLGAPTVGLPAGKDTYVIVHGAWGGGWQFKTVDEMLSADGHKVYRPTLTGQGEHVNLASDKIDLDTHIQDVVNVIVWEDLHDVVLVGHSYGGMVITGVMNRVPDRIKRVVFLDAFLPDDGQSLNTSRGNTAARGGNAATSQPGRAGRGGRGFQPAADGLIYLGRGPNPNQPPPHDVGQAPLTLSQPVSFNNPAAKKLPVTYILTVDRGAQPQQDTFYPFYERAKARGYTVLTMEGDHNVQTSHPREVVELLEKK